VSQAVQQLKTLLHDQPESPLKPSQVAEREQEMVRLESMVRAPGYVGGDRSGAAKKAREIRASLERFAPKVITDQRRDQVAKLAQAVLDENIRPALLPRAVMQRNPAGAVGQFSKRELSPQFKDAVYTWRRAKRALDPNDMDPDATNYEVYRPEGGTPGASSFMVDAQLPGNFAMSNQAKANWPLGEPTIDTPLKQAQRAAEAPRMDVARRQKQRDNLAKARAAQKAKREAERMNPAGAGVSVQGNGRTDEEG
jgi:hypothetical protein